MLNPVLKKKNLEVVGLDKYSSVMSLFYKDIYTDRYALADVILSNYLTVTISSLTLFIVLFVFTPQETLSMTNILALILFNS